MSDIPQDWAKKAQEKYTKDLNDSFNKMLSMMPKSPDKKCYQCNGEGEFYANEGVYLPCYCTNNMMYFSDAEIIFYLFILNKKNGKPKKNAIKIFEDLWMLTIFRDCLRENKS